MKYALRGITAEELSYTINRIKMDKDTKFEIKPQFSRTVRRVNENDKIWFVAMEVKVESTEESPKPFNLKVRLVGAFEAEGVETEEQREFLIEIGCELAQGYLYHRPDALDSILYKQQNCRRNHQVVTRERLKELI